MNSHNGINGHSHPAMSGDNQQIVGVLEWFRPGEEARVEKVLADLKALNVRHLRTGVSWADCHEAGGLEWYDWLLPHLAREIEVLPCFGYTPPSLGVQAKTSAPPRDPKAFADFLDMMISRHGAHFDWVELWNEPNNLREWDWTLDPDWLIFTTMVGGAAYWAKQRGKRVALGGLSPIDPNLLRVMGERGVLQHVDAVGIHGFPGTFEYAWDGWVNNIARVRHEVDEWNPQAEIWITEAGFSTWKHDERAQIEAFIDALDAPASRLYWYAARDLHPDLPTVDGLQSDAREYFFGLKKSDGTPKLLSRLWQIGGIEGVRRFAEGLGFGVQGLGESRLDSKLEVQPDIAGNGVHSAQRRSNPTLITGGCGFIGTNLADRLLGEGRQVVLFDNLSRPGVERNWKWLRDKHGASVRLELSDVRDAEALRKGVRQADEVFHLAAQVAVTTSLTNPFADFEVNARGTLNLLEALRERRNRDGWTPPLVFTSTNKVYGGLDDIALKRDERRYEPEDEIVRARGIGESRALDFHSPYGCSKGAADQYVLDYARTFDLRACAFRMSCIYGPHQQGNEDQGWVAHFVLKALKGEAITLFGDGRQVRDVLFVEDLIDAILLARRNIEGLSGQAFNIGGGPENTTSLLELIDLIGRLHDQTPDVHFDDWRPGDQRYYVSDTRKFGASTGWEAQIGVEAGVSRLYDWICAANSLSQREAVTA